VAVTVFPFVLQGFSLPKKFIATQGECVHVCIGGRGHDNRYLFMMWRLGFSLFPVSICLTSRIKVRVCTWQVYVRAACTGRVRGRERKCGHGSRGPA
jgi:hypothetical protein